MRLFAVVWLSSVFIVIAAIKNSIARWGSAKNRVRKPFKIHQKHHLAGDDHSPRGYHHWPRGYQPLAKGSAITRQKDSHHSAIA